METTLIIVLAIFAALLVILTLRQMAGSRASASQGEQMAAMVQSQIEALRAQMSDSLGRTTSQLTAQLQNNVTNVSQQLGDFRKQLYATTDVMNLQLANVTKQVQEATGQVGQRLDSAAKVIGDVKENLGHLGKATQEIKEVGQSVAKLDEILRAPKLRGGMGEMMLEDLLKQVIPPAHYQMQHRFKSRETVDAIIKLAEAIVPIDAKFPLENFRKMMATSSEAERALHGKAFVKDVRAHVDAIASKYILPDERTMNFALMFVPAENVYYEAMIRDQNLNEAGSLYSYAISKRVVPVSPNNFYAYLQVIALGLKGLQIEKSAQEIHGALGRLQGDLGKFSDVFAKIGTQLGYARSNFDEADRKLANFKDKLQNVVGPATAESLPAPPSGLLSDK
jgi:DNA recombination protein RmuC